MLYRIILCIELCNVAQIAQVYTPAPAKTNKTEAICIVLHGIGGTNGGRKRRKKTGF